MTGKRLESNKKSDDNYDLSKSPMMKAMTDSFAGKIKYNPGWNLFNGTELGGGLIESATAASTLGSFLWGWSGKAAVGPALGISAGNIYRENANHTGRQMFYEYNTKEERVGKW